LPAATAEKSRVYLLDVPGEAEKLIWQMQAQALAPLVAAGKLGCVLFQFPHWFTIPGVSHPLPSEASSRGAVEFPLQ
jgi:hypothetical protein